MIGMKRRGVPRLTIREPLDSVPFQVQTWLKAYASKGS
jgi:hypothetical protein